MRNMYDMKVRNGCFLYRDAHSWEEFMLLPAGTGANGRPVFEAVPVKEKLPYGWKEAEGGLTAPYGYGWISNGKSRFSGLRKTALLRIKEAV